MKIASASHVLIVTATTCVDAQLAHPEIRHVVAAAANEKSDKLPGAFDISCKLQIPAPP